LAVYHSTIVLEVRAAVSHVETVMVAVARLVLRVRYDGVSVSFLDAAVRVLAIAALPGSPAAALQGCGGPQQGEEREEEERVVVHGVCCAGLVVEHTQTV